MDDRRLALPQSHFHSAAFSSTRPRHPYKLKVRLWEKQFSSHVICHVSHYDITRGGCQGIVLFCLACCPV
uniref:Uncharacterized protein n=1 Tax=Anguilla anguilla TaxID=7936 RepID=A0A0E9Q441_ANGAN